MSKPSILQIFHPSSGNARNILNAYEGLKAYDDNQLCSGAAPRPAERSIAASGFNVWPNPVQGIVQIKSESAMQKITFTDLNGRVWQEQTFDNVRETTLTLPNLASGVYLISVIGSSGSIGIQKLVVLH